MRYAEYKAIFLLLTVAAPVVATASATTLPAVADVFPSRSGQHAGGSPTFTSGNVGNGGGGALMVHIGDKACATHFKDFLPTNEQTGSCD
jgi:hypothetical protein